ncbi:MAG: murein L,D-transpeptidase family protein [Sphingomonadaceae bacterium]
MIQALLLAAVLGAAAIAGAQQFETTDDRALCEEDGGTWFGDLGCETEAPTIDRIVVDKSERTLWAYSGDRRVRTFQVALGRDPVGPKLRQGDGRTPEGTYAITAHNPASAFHLSLRIGYPTPAQRAAARAGGYRAGGNIMIHGLPNGQGGVGSAHRETDWTEGCIALTNDEIAWLYAHTPVGAVVEIGA